jgi:hypothetical protein
MLGTAALAQPLPETPSDLVLRRSGMRAAKILSHQLPSGLE